MVESRLDSIRVSVELKGQSSGPSTAGNARSSTRIGEKWAYETGYAFLVAASAALVLSPVLRRSGWPLNQGTTAPLLLVQIYAAHIKHLDLLPVWSSTDAFGMGSPVLLYYHHAFYYLAGVIYALGVSLKASVVVTLAIFLVVGAYGMRRALSLITDSKLLCTVGSLGFLFTNYVFTDWLDPRGDLGEFSALMIVPWLIYWCIDLVKNRRFSYQIVPIMVLLVVAHTAIALTSLFLLIVTFVVFLAFSGTGGLRAIAGRLVVSVVSMTALLTPLLLTQLRFNQDYDPQTKNILGYNAEHQFVSIGRYFFDGMHQWFAAFQIPPFANFVQIDFAIWIPIALGVAFLAARSVLRAAKKSADDGLRHTDPALVLLVASCCCYLFLQLRISYFVYRVLTPLQVTNFPWRMLAFITPLGVVLVAYIADKAKGMWPNRPAWYTAAAVWLASLVLLSPIPTSSGLNVTPTGLSSMALFSAPKAVDYNAFKGYFSAQGAPLGGLYDPFLPKVVTRSGVEIKVDSPLYAKLREHDAGAEVLAGSPCTVKGPSNASFETLQLTFAVDCAGPAILALPISYNPSSSIYVSSGKDRLRQIPYFHRLTDPRLLIHVSSAGKQSVVVHLPTLWGSLF